jgi:hypothetical protein
MVKPAMPRPAFFKKSLLDSAITMLFSLTLQFTNLSGQMQISVPDFCSGMHQAGGFVPATPETGPGNTKGPARKGQP